LFAGRSWAEKEAAQDAQLLVMLLGGSVILALALALNALFTAVGLRFGWWAVPVFVPLFVWLFVSALCDRLLRPVELEDLRWGQRLRVAGVLAVVLWVVWPLCRQLILSLEELPELLPIARTLDPITQLAHHPPIPLADRCPRLHLGGALGRQVAFCRGWGAVGWVEHPDEFFASADLRYGSAFGSSTSIRTTNPSLSR
jgi:hypothetical protein